MRPIAASALALGFFVIALPAFGSADELDNRTSSKWGKQAAAGQAGQTAQPDNGSDSTTGGNGPASDAPAKRAPSTPMAGYAYDDKSTRTSNASAPRPRYRTQGPVVNMPGFEQTADGGSRLFVQLSQSVPVEERKAPGSITYVLKGASPRVWNNTNALVTVHFNTPVSRARLVPHGRDVAFVIDLRADATPTWKMNEAGDKGATLTIEFPKGDYLQGAGGGEAPSAEGAPAPAKPAPAKAGPAKRGHGKGRGKKGDAAPASPAGPAPAAPAPAPSGPKP